jgi:hypothetical protein
MSLKILNLMKPEEIIKYEDALVKYTHILRGKYINTLEISDCIKILEGFEDYEKCDQLIQILEENKNKINH